MSKVFESKSVLKRIAFLATLMVCSTVFLCAQEVIPIKDDAEYKTSFSTIVRIEAASIVSGPFSLSDYAIYQDTRPIYYGNGLLGPNAPQIVVDIVPLVSSFVGIPIVIDIGVYPKSFGLGAMTGIEFTPIKRFAPGGLFARANVGAYWIPEISVISFIGRADVGWQFVSSSGFVITPGFGFKYNSYSGNSLDLMIDIGGAF